MMSYDKASSIIVSSYDENKISYVHFKCYLFQNAHKGEEFIQWSWGGSRGGSGGSVELPKLNVKTYNKRVV